MNYKGSFGLGDPEGVTFENCRFSNEPTEPEPKQATDEELFECVVAAFFAWFGTVMIGLVTGIGVSAAGEQPAGQESIDIVAKGFGYGVLAGLPLAYEAFFSGGIGKRRLDDKFFTLLANPVPITQVNASLPSLTVGRK